MKNNVTLTIIIVLFLGLGAGFFAGTKYQENKQTTFGGRFNDGTLGNMNSPQGQNRMRTGGGMTTGEIISSDDKSVTIKLPDNSTKIILYSGSTVINRTLAGSQTDLTVGSKVGIFGKENTDGSITAQSIQLNPIIRTGVSGTPRQ